MSQALVTQKNSEITFETVQKMSEAVAKSGLFGVKNKDQALALLLLAQAEGLHPMVAARDYDIIQGRPSKKSEAMLRSFIDAGGKVKWIQLTDKIAEAEFSHSSGGTITIAWTIEMAIKAGLLAKTGSMYKKYPRQMLRARCVSEGVKTVCPSATGGLLSPEETQDIVNISEAKGLTSQKNDDGSEKSTLEKAVSATDNSEGKPVEEVTEAEFKEEKKREPEENKKTQKWKVEGKIEKVLHKSGETNGKPWNKYACKINGTNYGTFSDTFFGIMNEAHKNETNVEIISEKAYVNDKTLHNIIAIRELWDEETRPGGVEEVAVKEDVLPDGEVPI